MEITQIGKMAEQYATEEVMTVIVAGIVAFIGYLTAKKTAKTAGGFLKNSSYAGMASMLLLLGGMGGMGAGIGELGSRMGDGYEEVEETQQTTADPLFDQYQSQAEALESRILSLTQEKPDMQLTSDQLVTIITTMKDQPANVQQDGELEPTTVVNPNLQAVLEYARERDQAAQQFRQDNGKIIVDLAKSQHDRNKSAQEHIIFTSQQRDQSEQQFDLDHTEVSPSDATAAYEDLPFMVEEEPAVIRNEESIMSVPAAWTSVFMGLASIIGGITVFSTRNKNAGAIGQNQQVV